METLIKGMLNKETLLDLVQNFIIFEKMKKEDAKTGTTTVETIKKLAAYVDIYDIAQAVEDGATVRIFYESRLAKVELNDEGRELVEQLDDELNHEELSETQKAKAKWTQLEALIGSENHIKNIAKDILYHFEQRQSVFEGKGMIVSMSRKIAAQLYKEIIKLRPEWHSDDLNQGRNKSCDDSGLK